jgi:hypothetical protein
VLEGFMSELIMDGMRKLDKLAYTFASKQKIKLEDMIFDDGELSLDQDQHLIEFRSSGKLSHVHISTDEIINYSPNTQLKLVMALMAFV